MSDYFDLMSVRLENPTAVDFANVQKLNEPKLQLIPTVSPQNNKPFDAFAETINKINNLPSAGPAYTYTDAEHRRYDREGKHYSPGIQITGYDIEDLLGKQQSAGTQFANSIRKGIATAGGTFVSSFLTIPHQIDLIRQGRLKEFMEDSTFSSIQEWLTNMEDTLPNYYTQYERDHPLMSAFSSAGAANFWGDKVFKNLGFSVGAIGAGFVQSAILTLATEGAGAIPAFVKFGTTLNKVGTQLFKVFRGVAKVATSTDDMKILASSARISRNMYSDIKAAADLARVKNGLQFLGTTYLSAQGEAFIEGYHNYVELKTDLYQKALKGELTDEEISIIDEVSQESARRTTLTNIGLLMVSNALQFPTLLGRARNIAKAASFVDYKRAEKGLEAISKQTARKSNWSLTKKILKDFATEAGEEGSQFITGNALHDYYIDRFDTGLREGLYEHIKTQFSDPHLVEEMFIGGLSGFLMGGPSAIRKRFSDKNVSDKIVENINSSLGRLNETVSMLYSAEESKTVGEEVVTKHTAFKELYNAVNLNKRQGTFDSFMSAWEDIKGLDFNEVNSMFGTTFKNQNESQEFVENLMTEMKTVGNIVDTVKEAYSYNPFKSNPITERIRKSFNPNDWQMDRIQEHLYGEFVSTMGYGMARTHFLKGENESIKQSLKTLGLTDESITFGLNFVAGNKKSMNEYFKFKDTQVKALEQELKYIEKMLANTDASTAIQPDIKADLKTKREAIKNRIDTIKERKEKMSKLSEGLKTEKNLDSNALPKDREELMHLYIREELNSDEVERWLKTLKTNKEEAPAEPAEETVAQATEQVATAGRNEQEAEQLNENLNPDTLAKDIVKVHEKVREEAPDPQSVPSKPEYRFFAELEEGDTIVINFKDSEDQRLSENLEPAPTITFKVELKDLENKKIRLKGPNNIIYVLEDITNQYADMFILTRLDNKMVDIFDTALPKVGLRKSQITIRPSKFTGEVIEKIEEKDGIITTTYYRKDRKKGEEHKSWNALSLEEFENTYELSGEPGNKDLYEESKSELSKVEIVEIRKEEGNEWLGLDARLVYKDGNIVDVSFKARYQKQYQEPEVQTPSESVTQTETQPTVEEQPKPEPEVKVESYYTLGDEVWTGEEVRDFLSNPENAGFYFAENIYSDSIGSYVSEVVGLSTKKEIKVFNFYSMADLKLNVAKRKKFNLDGKYKSIQFKTINSKGVETNHSLAKKPDSAPVTPAEDELLESRISNLFEDNQLDYHRYKNIIKSAVHADLIEITC